MEADYDLYEVVYVIDGARLIDPESYERRYVTADGGGLAPGYYTVVWPEESVERRFNQAASYYGPFKYRQDARRAIGWLKLAKEYLAATPRSGKKSEKPFYRNVA